MERYDRRPERISSPKGLIRLANAHPRKGEASIGEAISSVWLDVPGF